MIFYRLLGKPNCGDVIKRDENGEDFLFCFGSNQWVKTGVMATYEWPDSPFFGMYEEVPAEKVDKYITEQEKQLVSLFGKAFQIASKAHEGQLDKGGNPYILHPVAVAESIDNLKCKIVALLHDVIEDTTVSENDLIKEGFPDYIVDAIKALTKPEGIDYFDYIELVKWNDIAAQVKEADLKNNLDISRIKNPSKKDYERCKKYKKALQLLGEEKKTEIFHKKFLLDSCS